MARRGIGTDQKIAVLGVAVLLLGALSLVALNQGARFGPKQATPAERALTQVRAQMGPTAEVRYLENGKRRAVCGYAGVSGERRAVAFVSRPDRILMGDDPLGAEFADMKAEFCPGFNAAAPAARSASLDQRSRNPSSDLAPLGRRPTSRTGPAAARAEPWAPPAPDAHRPWRKPPAHAACA